MWHDEAREFMLARGIAAWLVHDFRGSNPVLSQLLPGRRFLTRRVTLVVPAQGEPRLLVSHIDAPQFSDAGVEIEKYLTWQQYREALVRQLPRGKVAMEYSAGGDLPVVGIVDAGTVEFVRTLGVEVVSSADLIQATIARWSAEALAGHARAALVVAAVKDDAFGFIRDRVAAGREAGEFEVQRRMHEGFRRAGLEWPDGPIVAANGHAGDPHFEPTAANSANIGKGDWVLIDLWAREPGDANIFSDITWVGCCGTPTARQVKVFEAVKAARDAGVRRAQEGWRAERPVMGFEVDDAARAQLVHAGFAEHIRHRTGHSLSPGPKVHGMGVNIDNTETHDIRELLPGVGFTIEPGLYFNDFGVRLEINLYVDSARGPIITSGVQDAILMLA